VSTSRAVELTLYSRPGCHLCEEMKAEIERAIGALPPGRARLSEVDISTDPALEAQYGLDIPVLLVGGRKAAKYRIGERELLKIVRGRSG
jgi:hypothetical protein